MFIFVDDILISVDL